MSTQVILCPPALAVEALKMLFSLAVAEGVGYHRGDKENGQKLEFIDTLFGLYAFLNGGDPAGVAAGTAPFDLSKVTMADV